MKLKINGFTNLLNFYDDKVGVLEIKDTKCFCIRQVDKK